MGQKVHPTGIRLGIAKDWNSTWYAEKGDYAEQLRRIVAAQMDDAQFADGRRLVELARQARVAGDGRGEGLRH